MITPDQIRAARMLLKWKQTDLAVASGVSLPTVQLVEGGKTDPRSSTLDKIQTAFERAGVEIVAPLSVSQGEGAGVRLVAAPKPKKKGVKT